jgi:hypothetical protein
MCQLPVRREGSSRRGLAVVAVAHHLLAGYGLDNWWSLLAKYLLNVSKMWSGKREKKANCTL